MSKWIDQLIEWNNRRILFKKALAFNKKSALKSQWNNDEAIWMCPDCGEIHKSTGWTMWTGSQYPECCKHPAGHVCYASCATGF